MGKASSSKKVARAARAAGKPGGRRNLTSLFTILISGIVVLGIVLIFVSRGKTADALPPKLGDHWHAAYGIYDCDHFISSLSDTVQDTTGLHTHGDGLMHIHPFGTQYTGKGANIGNWGKTTGLELSDTKIKAADMDRENGDKCGDKKGTLQLKVWDGLDDDKGHLIDKDYADYAPQEFTLWTLAFVAEGTDIPKPPDEAIKNLQAPADVTGQPPASTPAPTGDTVPVNTVPAATVPGDTATTAPGTTETTAPGATTAPPDTTPTTAPATTVTTTP